jgi:hypothetical protein
MTEIYSLSLSVMAGLMFAIWLVLVSIAFSLINIAARLRGMSK